jgi:hypothetical protein
VDIQDALPTPRCGRIARSPNGRVAQPRSITWLPELAQPIHRIAGARINLRPTADSKRRQRHRYHFESIAEGSEKKVCTAQQHAGRRELLARR